MLGHVLGSVGALAGDAMLHSTGILLEAKVGPMCMLQAPKLVCMCSEAWGVDMSRVYALYCVLLASEQ